MTVSRTDQALKLLEENDKLIICYGRGIYSAADLSRKARAEILQVLRDAYKVIKQAAKDELSVSELETAASALDEFIYRVDRGQNDRRED